MNTGVVHTWDDFSHQGREDGHQMFQKLIGWGIPVKETEGDVWFMDFQEAIQKGCFPSGTAESFIGCLRQRFRVLEGNRLFICVLRGVVGSWHNFLYLLGSESMELIFSSYFEESITTVALPLSAETLMMESSFFRSLIALFSCGSRLVVVLHN